jgi:hypothetical protein
MLAHWTGREPTQRAFEAIGFSLHKAWQNEIVQFCGEQQSDLINRYWDEVAIETMQSLGQGAPDKRAFAIQPKYRSTFLDELFAARDFVEPRFPSPPLVKCLFEHERKVLSDREFAKSRIAFFSSLQKQEAERFGIDVASGLKKKNDVIPYLERFCGGLGFEDRARNRWRKQVGNCLVFEIGVSLGGNVFRMWSPLKFRFFHTVEPKYAFETEGAAVLGRLVPGAQMYRPWGSDAGYILGVRALLELFNVIAGSFD